MPFENNHLFSKFGIKRPSKRGPNKNVKSSKKIVKKTKTVQPPYGPTLPSSCCKDGYPISKYSGSTARSWEVLYSIWLSYQETEAAKFTLEQYEKESPNDRPNPPTGPANMFFIRHGEKNTGDNNKSQHINANGIYRSTQIVEYINLLAKEGYPISYIITCNPCPYNSGDCSMRPEQTIGISSYLLNIPMFIFGYDAEYDKVVQQLFESGIFNGLNVLICWEHSRIQSLLKAIIDAAHLFDRSELDADHFFERVYNTTQTTCKDGTYQAKVDENGNIVPPGSYPEYLTTNPYYRYYPYWNDDNFNHVYSLLSNPCFKTMDFFISIQPCLTCYASCELSIGLYQPTVEDCVSSSYKYYGSDNNIEEECELPLVWKTNDNVKTMIEDFANKTNK